MFCLVMSPKKELQYILEETGPNDIEMNEEKEGRLMECTFQTLEQNVDITTKILDFIKHNYSKKIIKKAKQPFAEGGQRVCFYGKLISTDQQNLSNSSETIVMKRFKMLKNRDGKQDYINLMEAQYAAACLATEFNKLSPAGNKKIKFLKVRETIFFNKTLLYPK